MGKAKTQRPFKGKSIIEFPNDYVVIDIETTGLSPVYDSIIEVAAIKYIDNTEVSRFTSLVRPEDSPFDEIYVDPFITALTGITEEMLAGAPPTSSVLRKFEEFIGDAILVGHNVGFDINFLYDNFEKFLDHPLTNEWINTARIFRRLYPELEHHRLEDLAEQYHVDYTEAHRAFGDCVITNSCLDKMKLEILEKYPNYEEFQKTFKKAYAARHRDPHNYKSNDKRIDFVPAYEGEMDVTHPLYKKVCVFTGALETMTRTAAAQIVANYGGEFGSSVTRKTNYLVLGNMDYCSNIKDGKSTKHKKAEQLKLDGQDIEIITESVFLDMVHEEMQEIENMINESNS